MRERRQKELKKRKNFLPSIFLTFIFWGVLGFLVYLIDPATPGVIIFFFIILGLSVFWPLSIILANTRRGLLTTIVIVGFLILRYFGIGNILNLFILSSLAVAVELWFWYTSAK